MQSASLSRQSHLRAPKECGRRPAATITRTREAASEKTMCWFPPSFQRSPADQLSKLRDLSDKSEPPSALQFRLAASYTKDALDSPRTLHRAHLFFGTFCWRCWFQHPPVPRVSTPSRKPAHASVGKSTVHRANPSLHPGLASFTNSTPEVQPKCPRRTGRIPPLTAARVMHLPPVIASRSTRHSATTSAHSLQQLFFHATFRAAGHRSRPPFADPIRSTERSAGSWSGL